MERTERFYNKSDDKVEDVPVIFPEVAEVVQPLEEDFEHEAVERAVIEDV